MAKYNCENSIGTESKITTDITVQSGGWPAKAHLQGLAESVVYNVFALPYLRGSVSDLSLVFTDDKAIRRLNADWRHIDKATNVLSFPAFPIHVGEKPQALLGDVVLAFETVEREAEASKKPLDNHIRHLILHGILHLLGYDHETEEEASIMETLEQQILAKLAIDDPYAEDL